MTLTKHIISAFTLGLGVSAMLALTGKTVSASDAVSPLTLSTIVDDMRLPHEARPRGVPLSHGWAIKPRRGRFMRTERYRAIAAWGQVYEAIQGSRSSNTRVQIRDIRSYYLSKRDRKWRLLDQSRRVDGAAFREDFFNNLNIPAQVRKEADGSISVQMVKGYNYHFWSSRSRVPIQPLDVAGLFIAVDARLIVNNPRQPDDRARARYLMSVGADYWTTMTAPWDHFKTNADVGLGRFRYIGPTWKTFTMTSLTEAELRRSPPPLR